MEYRRLGSEGPKVSAVCFGCWAIGGVTFLQPSLGRVDDEESIAAIRKAMELGVNFFDTADVYGCGHSEEVLGETLGKDRKKVVLATKTGHDLYRPKKHHGERAWIIQSCEESLRRLRTDYIDLYQIHSYDPDTPISETMETLTKLKETGKIKYIGVSNKYNIPQMEEALKYTHIDSLQVLYNMLQRENEKLFSFCLKKGIGVIPFSPIAKGLLTGKFNIDTKFEEGDSRLKEPLFQGENFRRSLEIVEKLRPIAKKNGKTLTQIAIAWVLSHPAVTSAIVGAKHPSQVEENIGGVGWKIPGEETEKIKDILAGQA